MEKKDICKAVDNKSGSSAVGVMIFEIFDKHNRDQGSLIYDRILRRPKQREIREWTDFFISASFLGKKHKKKKI